MFSLSLTNARNFDADWKNASAMQPGLKQKDYSAIR